MRGPPELAGYVTDIPYVADFKPMLAPAWLDFVALLGGTRPPARRGGFAWCDLGCGQGVTAAILAATHPSGTFHGIDAMPVHVDHAVGLATDAGAANAHFHTADFAGAFDIALPRFDYIVAHGVYSWVGAEVRAQLRRFIDHRLAPGGLVYVSYNALPGWTRDLPFQHLVRALARGPHGDSAARFAAASQLIDRLAQSGAAALASSYIVRELRERPDEYRPGYVVHEFLHAGWQPLYVTEVRRDMAEIGLAPIGSAILFENFDGWVLGRRARALLDEITDPDLRELVRDFAIDQRFRCDVFARDAGELDDIEQRRLLFAAGFALARPPASITYRASTPAGQLDYANPAARAVVGALVAGARNLGDIPAETAPPQDLLANALALCAAGDLRPVETGRIPVEALNRALRRRPTATHETPLIALPCGTALELDRHFLGHLGGEMNRARRDFLALHGV
ncbi:MAG: class I SAM-dependent methyltransferase [Alphaproteobacteria bacterium]